MLFVVIHEYAKNIKECNGYDLLNISKPQWQKYKKNNYLPLKHCKTLSNYFNCNLTDNFEELSSLILKKYFEEVSNG